MKFECKKCHYIVEKEALPKRCPYCGEEGTLGKATVAQDILDEVVENSRE
ncbi:MAG: hypothetical protein KAK00_01920 [Nanoarchaeota archaeon]|nr:hypothetical protein [Nanoarchaeota archaeon]